VETLVPKE
jgi:hypothetical protein